jgi:single-strand selective monofunctional uracil DNA glycosylase
MNLQQIMKQLCREVEALSFAPPVAFTYNPLSYAWKPLLRYLDLYGREEREVLLLGMNPGPWGMAQTGIPFGEVEAARDWLSVEAEVRKPNREHPRRPVLGFDCPRSEVSGRRIWGWAASAYRDPENFFRRFFITNYCPLCFLEESGRNRTPDKLPAVERDPLFEVCDNALRRTVEYLRARHVIGVGAFAETRARIALSDMPVNIGRILHPSPASPLANKGWQDSAVKQMAEFGISP